MIYFLDTSTIRQLVRGERAAVARLTTLAKSDRLLTNTVVRGELLFGIQRLPHGSRRDALQEKVEAVLAGVECVPLDPAVAPEYAAVKRAQQQKGMSLDENDLWIAASARFHGATLVAGDRDFQSIDGIRIEDWSG